MDYIGIDVHKVSTQVCIQGGDGELREFRIPTTRHRLVETFGAMARARVLLEASTESEWVARCLERVGHEVVIADPGFAPMYATRSRKVKTDRGDARCREERIKADGPREPSAEGAASRGRAPVGEMGRSAPLPLALGRSRGKRPPRGAPRNHRAQRPLEASGRHSGRRTRRGPRRTWNGARCADHPAGAPQAREARHGTLDKRSPPKWTPSHCPLDAALVQECKACVDMDCASSPRASEAPSDNDRDERGVAGLARPKETQVTACPPPSKNAGTASLFGAEPMRAGLAECVGPPGRSTTPGVQFAVRQPPVELNAVQTTILKVEPHDPWIRKLHPRELQGTCTSP